jgi:hypothetical protein
VKNVGLAWVAFTLNACDDPIAGANDVPALKRVDPSVVVHDAGAMFASVLAVKPRAPVVSDNLALTHFSPRFSWAAENFHIVVGMVAVPEPLRRVNDDWLFPELHYAFS